MTDKLKDKEREVLEDVSETLSDAKDGLMRIGALTLAGDVGNVLRRVNNVLHAGEWS